MRNIVIGIAITALLAAGVLFYVYGLDKLKPESNNAPKEQEGEDLGDADNSSGVDASYSEFTTEINDRELFASRIEMDLTGAGELAGGQRIIEVQIEMPKHVEPIHYAQANINGGGYNQAWPCEFQDNIVNCKGEESLEFGATSFFDIYYLAPVSLPGSGIITVEPSSEGKIRMVVGQPPVETAPNETDTQK